MPRPLRGLLWCVLFILLVACQSAPVPSATRASAIALLPGGAIVVRNGTIIDGTGSAPLSNGLVAIQDGQIIAVGPEAQFRIPDDARIIDAQGGTILPGFIDAHTHILDNSGMQQATLGRWLHAGVTTVRDLGSRYGSPSTPSLSIATLKQRLATFGNTVPTIVIAGPIVTAPGGYPVPIWGRGLALEVAGVEEARQAVAQLLADGADEIKIAVEQWMPEQPIPTLSLEQVQAITEIAHRKGTRVSAHVMRVADAQTAIDSGVDDLAHMILIGGKLPDEFIQGLVNRNVWIVPTLVVEDSLVTGLDEEQARLFLELRQENLRRYLAAGGQVALGSDYGNPGILPGMPLAELQRMVEFGMTPMQVIVAATRNAAQVCNLGHKLGTLEVGKQADVIVVRGDPLEDIQAMGEVLAVIKNGEVIVQP